MPTDKALGRESDQRRNVSQRYENDKKLWAAAISNMEKKIKVKLDLVHVISKPQLGLVNFNKFSLLNPQAMKEKQALLSLEAHECANAIPDLSKMIGAVQALGNI